MGVGPTETVNHIATISYEPCLGYVGNDYPRHRDQRLRLQPVPRQTELHAVWLKRKHLRSAPGCSAHLTMGWCRWSVEMSHLHNSRCRFPVAGLGIGMDRDRGGVEFGLRAPLRDRNGRNGRRRAPASPTSASAADMAEMGRDVADAEADAPVVAAVGPELWAISVWCSETSPVSRTRYGIVVADVRQRGRAADGQGTVSLPCASWPQRCAAGNDLACSRLRAARRQGDPGGDMLVGLQPEVGRVLVPGNIVLGVRLLQPHGGMKHQDLGA